MHFRIKFLLFNDFPSYNIRQSVLSGILLSGNFVLTAYFSVQSIAVYVCTFDIADISEGEDNDVSVV